MSLHEAVKKIIIENTFDFDDEDEIADKILAAVNRTSAVPLWISELPMQQQTVLFLALRGPDGIRKHHPMKTIQRAYRGSIVKAAYYGKPMTRDSVGDSFMDIRHIFKALSNEPNLKLFKEYFDNIDELPHHFHNHLMHGAQILGYKHPDEHIREFWHQFYLHCVDDAHLVPESQEVMDQRIGDWGRQQWDKD